MTNSNYFIADTWEKQQEVLRYLRENPGFLAVDTETTGTDIFTDKLVGVSLSRLPGEAFYIVVRWWDAETKELREYDVDHMHALRAGLIELLEDPKQRLVMHNATFDLGVLKQGLGVECVTNLHADTILMKHTLDEVKPHGLKDVAIKYLGGQWNEPQDDLKESVLANGGKWLKQQKDMYMGDLPILGKYACADADMTLQLFYLFDPELINQGLHDFFYNQEVMPLVPVIFEMHYTGIKIDVEYYEKLAEELRQEIKDLEYAAHQDLMDNYQDAYGALINDLLGSKYPLKKSGALFNKLYEKSGLPVVLTKSGKPSLAKKVIEMALEDEPDHPLLLWKLDKMSDEDFVAAMGYKIRACQQLLHREATGQDYIINFGSNDQLGTILFTHLGEEVQATTATGKPKVDVRVLESLEDKYKFIKCIMDMRKAAKLLSTYVESVLDKHVDGVIHPGWVQYGTETGRFSCRKPNYQNLPRDDKRIKKGIIAREGKVFIGADFSQLEARCFSHMSREPALIQAYINGEDIYGAAAVQIYNLDCHANDVKEQHPDLRQKAKAVVLAITYGAKKWKIAKMTGMTVDEAGAFINNFWQIFPILKEYVDHCHQQVMRTGQIINEVGRVRRVKEIFNVIGARDGKSLAILSNCLNTSTNYPIQSLAAAIVNRAMIAIYKQLKALGIDAKILLQVHDEIGVETAEEHKELVSNLMKEIMETTYQLSVPLIAEPVVGTTLADTKE